jgi:nitrilase
MSKVRVGAVQSEPVWLNLEGSVDKTISLIKSAASDGVKVLGFPEVWIPGYPWYIYPTILTPSADTSNAGEYGRPQSLVC